MKVFFIAALLIFSNYLSAQTLHGNDHVLPVVGEFPQSNNKYKELRSGTPYFQDEWVKAKLRTIDGMIYKDVTVKLNLVDERVHLKDEKGNESMIKSPLAEIQFNANSKGQEYHFINGVILPKEKKGWQLLLVNDTITLLKSIEKKLIESKSYGSPIEYSIDSKEKYIVVYGKEIFDIKKVNDFTDVLPAKKAEIEAEIKKIKNLSKEEQFIAVVQYLNTIR